METLVDIVNAIRTRRSRSFKSLRFYVVNYSAPHLVFYNGCTVLRPNGKYCARSTDSLERCKHNALAIKYSEKMYQFQLQLTDGSPSPPVYVTIFEQAHILLGVSAKELSCRTESQQLDLLKDATSKGSPIDVYLRVKSDNYKGEFVAVVEMLFRLDMAQEEVLDELLGTPTSSPAPTKSPSSFHTPRGEKDNIASSSGSESSASLKTTGGRGRNKLEKLSNAKLKLILDLIQVIYLSNEED